MSGRSYSYVIMKGYAGHTYAYAVTGDEETAEAYADYMNASTDNFEDYWVEEAENITDEDIPEREEMSDAEYKAERDAMRADDYWAEHGSAGLANLH